MASGNATWTCHLEHGPLWYIKLAEADAPPYFTQREVRAVLDIDQNGKLAGVELIEDMPSPPATKPTTTD